MDKWLRPQRKTILVIIIIIIIVSGIIIIIVLTPLLRPPIPQLLVDRNGVTKIYETKGEEKYGFEYEHSSRLERDEFYLEDVAVVDGEYTAYIKLDIKENDDDEISFKLRGGKHNDDHRLAGRCYAIGVEFNGEPHLAKEYPEHPKTPKFQNEIKVVDNAHRNIGELNGRWVGLKVIIYNNRDNSVQIEVYVDNKGLLDNDNPANDWKLWWTATDDGHWTNNDGKKGGKPYLELQGEKGGTSEMVYIRIDQMEEEGQTEIKYESVREIDSSTILEKRV
jgi:predicted small secreted protein